MLSIIVAIDKNNGIGKNNDLLCHLPEDLKRFKRLTTGHNIIMGRKTFESLGRVLSNRKHIILTKDVDFKIDDKNVEIVNDILLLQKYIESEEENFVIGGGSIYKLLMPYTNKMYITHIFYDFDADVFFPKIKKEEWHIVAREWGKTNNTNPYNYEYITYLRKK